MGSQTVEASYRNGGIPVEIAEEFKELFPEDEDFEDILQDQESIYQSLQANSRSNTNGYDQSSDLMRSLSGNEAPLSRSESVDSQLNEAIALSLLELEGDLGDASESVEPVADAPGNTEVSSVGTSVVATAQDNVDPDNMSYEQLQSLGEAIGIESRGLSKELMSRLPSQKYKARSGFFSKKVAYTECVICYAEFEKEEWLTKLACKHEYHTHCIKRWLEDHKNCPVCNKDLSQY